MLDATLYCITESKPKPTLKRATNQMYRYVDLKKLTVICPLTKIEKPIYQQQLEDCNRVKKFGSQTLQSKFQAKEYHNTLFMNFRASKEIYPGYDYSILREK